MRERFPRPTSQYRWALDVIYEETESMGPKSGMYFMRLVDAASGDLILSYSGVNKITYDAGILSARLVRGDAQNPLLMLAVGTGATGDPLHPDAPSKGQRKLNAEIYRKTFQSKVYRDASGVIVPYPTNIVDYTVELGASEAVGALTEMSLIAPANTDPLILNPINNGPTNYDPTIDVTGKDLLANYATFGAMTKPLGATLTITWRLTH